MAKDNITPEEKLLKIIENPDGVEKKRNQPHLDFSKNGLQNLLKNFLPQKGSEGPRFDMQILNKALAAVCIIVTLFAVIYFIKENAGLNRKFAKIIAGPSTAAKDKEAAGQAAKTEEAEPASKRNLFTLTPKEKPIERADLTGGVVELKLVGILWSDNPQAMIEDTKDQKTLLVGKGDKIGNVTVKDILVNKVVLTKDGQEWDLR